MFKIIKNFNWIILSSFLCIYGDNNFLTFINEGFVPLTDKLQTLLIIDILLLLIFHLFSKISIDFITLAKKIKKDLKLI